MSSYDTWVHRSGRLAVQFLDTVGDGTGNINMNVDGSVTEQVFKVVCPVGYTIQLESVGIFIQDSSPFTAANYGKLPTLTNGVRLEYTNGANTTVATAQLPIKKNADWIAYAFRSDRVDFGGGTEILSGEYNLGSNGRSLKLSEGDEYRVVVADDLTGLIAHYFRVSFVMAKN